MLDLTRRFVTIVLGAASAANGCPPAEEDEGQPGQPSEIEDMESREPDQQF